MYPACIGATRVKAYLYLNADVAEFEEQPLELFSGAPARNQRPLNRRVLIGSEVIVPFRHTEHDGPAGLHTHPFTDDREEGLARKVVEGSGCPDAIKGVVGKRQALVIPTGQEPARVVGLGDLHIAKAEITAHRFEPHIAQEANIKAWATGHIQHRCPLASLGGKPTRNPCRALICPDIQVLASHRVIGTGTGKGVLVNHGVRLGRDGLFRFGGCLEELGEAVEEQGRNPHPSDHHQDRAISRHHI